MPALSRAEAQALFEPQEINCPHLTRAMAAEGFVAEVAQVEEAESPQPEAEVEAPAEVPQSVEVAPVEVAPAAPKKDNLPTCYFLATSAKCTKEYEGDYRWMIELEKGWSAWMPGNEPYYGNTDLPMKYRLGRYDFEVHFESDKSGTQTNLTTGKVRRVQKIMRGEPLPAWEGTGIRRRTAEGTTGNFKAPANSAAAASQKFRDSRRDGYEAPLLQAGSFTPAPGTKTGVHRPQVSSSAYKAAPAPGAPKTAPKAAPKAKPAATGTTGATGGAPVPRYMRQLKSKA
ncbi:unnamed protein product [Effrenium voratum]|uniref:Uncharacterized protein n=1 Tax=Effrenium voratum TaxID=2562239 RepID=A0AA36JJ82_9DINO|nr:unnamed protein product [Effrenium voratum]CAJ1451911.1 unnamed protein product [Effrenium voratum]